MRTSLFLHAFYFQLVSILQDFSICFVFTVELNYVNLDFKKVGGGKENEPIK